MAFNHPTLEILMKREREPEGGASGVVVSVPLSLGRAVSPDVTCPPSLPCTHRSIRPSVHPYCGFFKTYDDTQVPGRTK